MASHIVRHNVWKSEVSQSGHEDRIIIKNLEITANAGIDVWGRPNKQRAYVTVTLTLGNQISSAATTDSVDDSTIHYGILSKAIREGIDAGSSQHLSTASLVNAIELYIRHTAGSKNLYASEVDVCYLKGSMFGDSAGLVSCIINSTSEPGLQSHVLYLRNMRIPCIIGVNPNERLQKQPVILSFWVDCISKSRHDDHVELETFVFTRVSESSFETIESLLEWIIDELKQKYFTKEDDNSSWIRLRIEKPLAVPFADASAVEITRPLHRTS